MKNIDLALFYSAIIDANVEIINENNISTLFFNNHKTYGDLQKELSKHLLNIRLYLHHNINISDKNEQLLHRTALAYLKNIDKRFPTIDGYLVNRNLRIIDNLRGEMSFNDLEENQKKIISEFVDIEKENFIMYIDILKKDTDKEALNIYKYPFKFNSSNSNIIRVLMGLYYQEFFIPYDVNSKVKLIDYISTSLTQLNIDIPPNLVQTIANIHNEPEAGKTFENLKESIKMKSKIIRNKK